MPNSRVSFFPAEQQAAKAVDPRVGALHHLSPGAVSEGVDLGRAFLPPAQDVSRIAPRRRQRLDLQAVMPSVQAQTLVVDRRGRGGRDGHGDQSGWPPSAACPAGGRWRLPLTKPVRRTWKMPSSRGWEGCQGRPPWGCEAGSGHKGSICRHSSSGIRHWASTPVICLHIASSLQGQPRLVNPLAQVSVQELVPKLSPGLNDARSPHCPGHSESASADSFEPPNGQIARGGNSTGKGAPLGRRYAGRLSAEQSACAEDLGLVRYDRGGAVAFANPNCG